MATVATERQRARVLQARIGISPFLVLTMLGLAVFIIYLVGIETMPLLHNAFHDLRHGTGFPCH